MDFLFVSKTKLHLLILMNSRYINHSDFTLDLLDQTVGSSIIASDASAIIIVPGNLLIPTNWCKLILLKHWHRMALEVIRLHLVFETKTFAQSWKHCNQNVFSRAKNTSFKMQRIWCVNFEKHAVGMANLVQEPFLETLSGATERK